MKLISILLLILIAGCGKETIVDDKQFIERLFWHENTRYSIFIKNNDRLARISYPSYLCSDSEGIHIYMDYKEKPVAISSIKYGSFSDPNPCVMRLDFYINSKNDIEGGGWNHGKFGSGQTHSIK